MRGLERSLSYNAFIVGAWMLLAISLWYMVRFMFIDHEHGLPALLGLVLSGFVLLGHGLAWGEEYVDTKLRQGLENVALKSLHVHSREFPGYRAVDLFRACAEHVARFPDTSQIDSRHNEPLAMIVSSRFYSTDQGAITSAPMVLRPTGYRETTSIPTERFWAIKSPPETPGESPCIIRFRAGDGGRNATLEVAAIDSIVAEAALEEIRKNSLVNSIYRGNLLEVGCERNVDDDYYEESGPNTLNIQFLARRDVTASDIVLEEEVRETLERNVFRFCDRREELGRWGIPARRVLLFHGPPGTGKTFTCQYIYGRLPGMTTFVAVGGNLGRIKDLCMLARTYQPSMLVLEDIDLALSSRETNPFGSLLGEFMDQLDGFQADHSVLFLLTTNAIERVEEAISSRPGRVNQCLHFGPPDDDLRHRYIERYLQPYEIDGLALDELVESTRGCTQAFLKELVLRAVQVSIERRSAQSEGDANGAPRLCDTDFDTAMAELTKHDAKATRAIMGFTRSR